ncbi:chromosomal replication initiator protein DnaA [Kordiimonas sp. SCSIO 12610]|uniref:chromosomal replication initiator protein DnaA n=1 Tax=Kordiimonas sp. SCSIO 12610 TaxID=2829597 RepID=UPI00210BB513|nr:chromosomal replication initiator protein DnaA [Kordiimonas sp. SCSIO 12610]UTW55314.1 chromosomal replication initiator protein DnaA [Kordiimonas sp. SCSIO 12610]
MPSDNAAVMNSSEQWDRVCTKFLREFGQQAYTNWLEQVGFNGINNDTVSLVAPTRFVRDWIKSHYAPRLKDYFNADNPNIQNVAIYLPDGANSAIQAQQPQETVMTPAITVEKKSETSFEGSPLDERYTFESFVVGKSNELAYAAAKRITEAEEVAFNPLFLHGGVGLGKTHLMHAIAWEVIKNQPSKKVVYVSAEKFMFEFIAALRFKDTHAFKQKFRNVDLLMIDDVQFIANKDSTQEEFFHTFNTLIDNRCQVIITADRSPTDLEGIQDRIISRLGWGLVADIHPTDYELRLGILQSKADAASRKKSIANPNGTSEKLVIPIEVLEFLAGKITSNVRELEGALNRVIAYATLVGRHITMDMTREVLQDLIRANNRQVTIDEIQRKVAEYYNIRLAEMLSDRRARNIVRPRQIAMYLSKEMTKNSLPEIGRRFGGRDHTTVMHGIRKVEELMLDDHQIEEDVMRLKRLFEA